ncbi:MAG: 23S rRNA (uracil(1939)-C(5))-methyltransferase RlmD [Lachnospiraceae bacterium]|nr:23S rRNA (uracil(1939)-C(5))-methyltransferase RlmD [Candidatus Colinaster equi]
MNKNDITTITITDMGIDGEGIGKVDGYTLFVKDTVVGDVASVKVIKAKKNYGYARLMQIVTPSPYRVNPVCELASRCGGCQLQAVNYDKQLEFKAKKVRNNIVRLGGFEETYIDSLMEPIVGMEHPYEYRNKAQFPFGVDKEGKFIYGFYAGRTHSIIPCNDCSIGVKENKKVLDTILEWMNEYNIAPYDEVSHKGIVRHALIRKSFADNRLMVCLIVNVEKYKNTEGIVPHQTELINRIKSISEVASLSINLNSENTNVIMGDEIINIWGSDHISDVIHLRDVQSGFSYIDEDGNILKGKELVNNAVGIRYNISPLSFYQVNPIQTEKLYSIALDYADLSGNESVWDLYCGIGTISLFLAKKAGKVIGVEIVPQAIDDAKKNAENNGIGNAEFYVGRAEEVLPEYYEKQSEDAMLHPDVIVVDPPRKGCDGACLDTMIKMAPARIVYVSCDSATLSRDLRVLCDGGYEIQKIRPVDMFPHTVHVETVCLLSKIVNI